MVLLGVAKRRQRKGKQDKQITTETNIKHDPYLGCVNRESEDLGRGRGKTTGHEADPFRFVGVAGGDDHDERGQVLLFQQREGMRDKKGIERAAF